MAVPQSKPVYSLSIIHIWIIKNIWYFWNITLTMYQSSKWLLIYFFCELSRSNWLIYCFSSVYITCKHLFFPQEQLWADGHITPAKQRSKHQTACVLITTQSCNCPSRYIHCFILSALLECANVWGVYKSGLYHCREGGL